MCFEGKSDEHSEIQGNASILGSYSLIYTVETNTSNESSLKNSATWIPLLTV
jgi:hypothetical protein